MLPKNVSAALLDSHSTLPYPSVTAILRPLTSTLTLDYVWNARPQKFGTAQILHANALLACPMKTLKPNSVKFALQELQFGTAKNAWHAQQIITTIITAVAAAPVLPEWNTILLKTPVLYKHDYWEHYSFIFSIFVIRNSCLSVSSA